VSPLGISPAQCDRQFFDYVFLGKPVGADCTVPIEKLNKLRNEFMWVAAAAAGSASSLAMLTLGAGWTVGRFWYPMDLRVSGKDLIQNHLTFSIYNHAAIFPEQQYAGAGWLRLARCCFS
jgi:leucyl-tRNA synthetase